jgi:hypothetical protein
MAVILKAIYRFSAILVKTPMSFFTEIEKNQSKNSYGNTKGPE